jgi:ribA/ribD-fused uncharacterized protein
VLWKTIDPSSHVVPFYGQNEGKYGCFSNFYRHASFPFVIPECCRPRELQEAGRSVVVHVSFSEKAIMLCKASIMKDYDTFDLILDARSPREAKRLGRQVSRRDKTWDQALWDNNVCEIAYEVVSQKFTKVDNIGQILLSTGTGIIAEMTDNDLHWATGIRIGHRSENIPSEWTGSNILGWALMQARDTLAAMEDESRARPLC